MKNSTKIWMVIAGVLLIILGIACIARPGQTLLSTAWLLGIFTLLSGIAELIFTFKTQAFLPNSGSRMLSSILQIIFGCILLNHNLFVAFSLPVIFSMWVLIESIILAVESFDLKQIGVPYWFSLLLLGIAGIVLGILGLRNPDVAGNTLSTLIGIAVILTGCGYIVMVSTVNRFEEKIDRFRKAIGPDEQ